MGIVNVWGEAAHGVEASPGEEKGRALEGRGWC